MGYIGAGITRFNTADDLTVTDDAEIGDNATVGGNLSVTGTTTLTDDLAVDTDTLFVDASENRVGVGTSSPSALVELDNGGSSTGDFLVFNLGGENREHSFENYIATGRDLRLNTARDFRIRCGADTAGFPTEGQIIFEDGTNGESMRIDSSGNILAATGGGWTGTVAESSTSSVFERGSNSNGEYIKYADGTMICWDTLDGDEFEAPSTFSTTVQGIVWYRSAIGNFFYASSFLSNPAVNANVNMGISGTMRSAWVRFTSMGTTGVEVQLVSPDQWTSGGSGISNLNEVYCVAVGRWY